MPCVWQAHVALAARPPVPSWGRQCPLPWPHRAAATAASLLLCGRWRSEPPSALRVGIGWLVPGPRARHPCASPPHPTPRLILRGRIRAHFACCFHTVIRGAWCLRVVQKSCTGLAPGPGEAATVPVLCRPSPGLHWPLKPWFSECGLGRGPGPLRALGPFPGRRRVRLFHSNPETLASRDRTAREFPEATRCVTAPRTNPRCRRPHQTAFVMLEVRFAEAMCITTPIFTNIFGKYCFSHKTIVRINVCQSPLPP